jgi:hypothetical protein
MPVAQVNDASRELEAMIGREYKDRSGQLATAGIASAYTLYLNRTIASYVAGLCFRVRAHLANSGPATIAVSGLDPKPLRRQNGTDLVLGDVVLHQIIDVHYNQSLDAFVIIGVGDSSNAMATPECTLATLPALTDKRTFLCTNDTDGPALIFNDGTVWRRISDRAVVSSTGSARYGTIPVCTVATVPHLDDKRLFLCTDEAGGAVLIFNDGSFWRRVTDRAVVS